MAGGILVLSGTSDTRNEYFLVSLRGARNGVACFLCPTRCRTENEHQHTGYDEVLLFHTRQNYHLFFIYCLMKSDR